MEQERGTGTFFNLGRQAGSKAGEKTPPQVAQMTNRFPHFLVYPGYKLNLGSPIFLPTPRPAPGPATCLARGKSQMPLEINLQVQ